MTLVLRCVYVQKLKLIYPYSTYIPLESRTRFASNELSESRHHRVELWALNTIAIASSSLPVFMVLILIPRDE